MKKTNPWWKLTMTKKDTAENLYKQCQKLFKCYTNLDLSKIKSDRTGNYTIEFSPNIEADEKWKNISADDLPKDRQFGTLEERMKLGIQYFKATGKHLDKDYWTLCAGSRGSGGDVPSCGWCGGEFEVYWSRSSSCGGILRAREAVSLVPSDTSKYVSREEFEEFKSAVEKVIKL